MNTPSKTEWTDEEILTAFRAHLQADCGIRGMRAALASIGAVRRAPDEANVRYDAENWGVALNDAGWEFNTEYRRVMGEPPSGRLFNSAKTILRACILKYLDRVAADHLTLNPPAKPETNWRLGDVEGQVDSWMAVFELCYSLGMRHDGSGKENVLNFIRERCAAAKPAVDGDLLRKVGDAVKPSMLRSVNDAAADAIRVVREHDAAKPDDTEYEEVRVVMDEGGYIFRTEAVYPPKFKTGTARFPRPKPCPECEGTGVRS